MEQVRGGTSHDTGREPRPQSRRAGQRGVRQIVAVRQNRSRARTRGSAGGAHAAGAEFGPYRPGRRAGYVAARERRDRSAAARTQRGVAALIPKHVGSYSLSPCEGAPRDARGDPRCGDPCSGAGGPRLRGDDPGAISRTAYHAGREPPAGRQSLVARSNSGLISGQNSRSSASVVMEPTRPFDQNTRRSPPAPIIAKRKASSARLPNTNASVNGASGMPIFLNT